MKTGNPAAVNPSFILFFSFPFPNTAFPQEALTGRLSAIADYNPVTYLPEALRSPISPRLRGIGEIRAVVAVSFTLAMAALRGRVSRG